MEKTCRLDDKAVAKYKKLKQFYSTHNKLEKFEFLDANDRTMFCSVACHFDKFLISKQQ